jgi:predicted Fe-Mo cluster-binding NifX family protein
MRIAVPSMGGEKKSAVSSTLGRCRFIMIYNSVTGKYSAIPNPGISLMDGSGIKAVETIVQSHADIVLTKEVGVKAYSALAKERVAVILINTETSVDEVIKKYLKK